MSLSWTGVMPAITTPFTADGDVDHQFLARHALWMIEAGCTGVVALGSLGETATLSVPEKLAVLSTLAQALGGRVPLVAGIAAGATGWVAGLVNAMPVESVRLFDLARRANAPDAAPAAQARARQAADELYRWFLPLLALDTVPKFVQLIKLVQQRVGHGHERVRAPRLVLEGAEREDALALIAEALATRPGNDA